MKLNNVHRSLATKWLAFQIIGLGLILCFVGVYQYYSLRASTFEDIRNSGEAVSQSIKEMLAEKPELFTTETLEPIVVRLAASIPDIARVVITDRAHHIIADSENTSIGKVSEEEALVAQLKEQSSVTSFFETGGEKYLRLSKTIEGEYDPLSKNNVLGVLTIDLQISHGERLIAAKLQQVMLVMASLLFVFWAVQYAFMRRGFLRWLRLLTTTAERFGKGDFLARAHVTTSDELGQLAEAFNRMAAEVEQSDSTLKIEIEERERSEAKVRESEERFRDLFENASDVIYTTDFEGNFTSLNQSGERMTGYTYEEARNVNFSELVSPETYKMVQEMRARKLHGHEETVYELEFLKKNGEPLLIEVSSRAIFENGKPVGIQGIGRDITQRKQFEAELKLARDVAIKSVRLKSEFLANMSHEIRTPMNGVIGMTGLLMDTNLDEEQRECAETIRSSGEALMTIINDILDFSKIEAGQLQFETLDFLLNNTVEDTIELLAERAHQKGIEFVSLVLSDVPTQLCGDPGRLRQVLTNLIGNAIKFTEHGEVVVRVEKESETRDEVVLRFVISDTGIGISEAAQANLFQAFMQADGSTTRKYGGTGLGLAISKQLVELMGGQIAVTSIPGEGSTFSFTAQFGKQAICQSLHEAPLVNLKNLRVLIVDDNVTNRKILTHQLGSWGMISREAESGLQALELLRSAEAEGVAYDLAVLDFMMPEMDGFQTARAIKSDPKLAGIHLVMLTSYGARGPATTAREAGVAAYLTKPVRQSQLFDCLVNVIDGAIPTEVGFKLKADSNPVTKHSLKETKMSSTKLILLAEDNIVNQKVAIRQLHKLGYRADAVANGREVIEALSRIPYDLVLMDCQMPEMDGYEATAEIRMSEPHGTHTPIVAMTANALTGDREKCIAAGMDEYISKPVQSEELARVLNDLFFLKAPRRMGEVSLAH